MKWNALPQAGLNYFQQLTSIEIEDQIWSVAEDVAHVLELNDTSNVFDSLEDDERNMAVIYRVGALRSMNPISESELYAFIFRSDTTNAIKFRQWVTHQVCPLARIHVYDTSKRLEPPNFVTRPNGTWSRVENGYLPISSELYIRLFGSFEHEGYILPGRVLNGTEMCPDISVVNYFDDYIQVNCPDDKKDYKTYQYRFRNGKEVEA